MNALIYGFDRITFDPTIMAGQACIRGMRIPVSLLLNLVANGMAVTKILEDYPDLEPADVKQALQYGAWLAERAYFHGSWVEIPC